MSEPYYDNIVPKKDTPEEKLAYYENMILNIVGTVDTRFRSRTNLGSHRVPSKQLEERVEFLIEELKRMYKELHNSGALR